MTLEADKWVRVMCDFSAEGIWHKDGCAASVEELPVPDEVRSLLIGWQLLHEKLFFPNEPPPPEYVVVFTQTGHAIARLIKRALPDWTVVYYDEEASREAGTGTPRSVFEYEVLL